MAIPIVVTMLIETTNARLTILMALPCFPVLYVYARHMLMRAHADHGSAPALPA